MKVATTAARLSLVLVAVSTALVVADGGIYLGLIYGQDEGGPAWWFVAGLVAAIVLGLGAIWRSQGPGSVVMGTVGGVILLVLGILGIFSVGLPLLVAGSLMLGVAAMRLTVRSVPVPPATSEHAS